MCPFFKQRANKSRTTSKCSGLEVRMKWSTPMPSCFHCRTNSLATRVAYSSGVIPAALAARSTFWPCSSEPVVSTTGS